MRLKRRKGLLFLTFTAILCILSVTGCSKYLLHGPTVLSHSDESFIDLSQENSIAEIICRVWSEDLYLLNITYDANFYGNDGNEIIQYLGGWQTPNGTGAHIPLHVLITRLTHSGEQVIVDEIRDGGGMMSFGSGITNTIYGYTLKAGKYKIRITNQKSHRQLKYVPVRIRIGHSYR